MFPNMFQSMFPSISSHGPGPDGIHRELAKIASTPFPVVTVENISLELGAGCLMEAVENGNVGVLNQLARNLHTFDLKQFLSQRQHYGRLAEALVRCPECYRGEVCITLERLGLNCADFADFINRSAYPIDRTDAVHDDHGSEASVEDPCRSLRTPSAEGSVFAHVDSHSPGSRRSEARFLSCTAGLHTIQHPWHAHWKGSERNAIMKAYARFTEGRANNCRTIRLFCARLTAEYGLRLPVSLLHKWLVVSQGERWSIARGRLPLKKRIEYAQLYIKQTQERKIGRLSFIGFSRRFRSAGKKAFSACQISSWVRDIDKLKSRLQSST